MGLHQAPFKPKIILGCQTLQGHHVNILSQNLLPPLCMLLYSFRLALNYAIYYPCVLCEYN
jgi:hypothetical protein